MWMFPLHNYEDRLSKEKLQITCCEPNKCTSPFVIYLRLLSCFANSTFMHTQLHQESSICLDLDSPAKYIGYRISGQIQKKVDNMTHLTGTLVTHTSLHRHPSNSFSKSSEQDGNVLFGRSLLTNKRKLVYKQGKVCLQTRELVYKREILHTNERFCLQTRDFVYKQSMFESICDKSRVEFVYKQSVLEPVHKQVGLESVYKHANPSFVYEQIQQDSGKEGIIFAASEVINLLLAKNTSNCD